MDWSKVTNRLEELVGESSALHVFGGKRDHFDLDVKRTYLHLIEELCTVPGQKRCYKSRECIVHEYRQFISEVECAPGYIIAIDGSVVNDIVPLVIIAPEEKLDASNNLRELFQDIFPKKFQFNCFGVGGYFPSLLDRADVIQARWSKVFRFHIKQKGGTCYWHAAVNSFAFNPFFRGKLEVMKRDLPARDISNISVDEIYQFDSETNSYCPIQTLIGVVDPFLRPPEEDNWKNRNSVYPKGIKDGGVPEHVFLALVKLLYGELKSYVRIDSELLKKSSVWDNYKIEEIFINLQKGNDMTPDIVLVDSDIYAFPPEEKKIAGYTCNSCIVTLYYTKNEKIHGHSVCVVRDELGQWLWIDSNVNFPIPMTYINETVPYFFEDHYGGEVDARRTIAIYTLTE